MPPAKFLTSASLALALVGGVIAFTPVSAEASTRRSQSMEAASAEKAHGCTPVGRKCLKKRPLPKRDRCIKPCAH